MEYRERLKGWVQVYRIDHYLGKEIAQNLIVLRFFNSFISPLWCHNVVDNVQITFMVRPAAVTGSRMLKTLRLHPYLLQ